MRVFVQPGFTFEYVKPAPLNVKLLLLTKDNVLVVGPWRGAPPGENKTYKGYCGLPDRDKDIEKKLGYL